MGQPVLGAELNRSENWGEESRLTQPLSQRRHLAHLLPHPPARGNRLRGVEAAHTKVAQNRAVTAAFRRYDSVSVCGIGPWKCSFRVPVSRGHFWCLVFHGTSRWRCRPLPRRNRATNSSRAERGGSPARLVASGEEEWTTADEQRACTRPHDRRKGGIQLVFTCAFTTRIEQRCNAQNSIPLDFIFARSDATRAQCALLTVDSDLAPASI